MKWSTLSNKPRIHLRLVHTLPHSCSPSQPCTLPIMLYLLVKNMSQSFSTPCSFSPRSSYSGLQSSGLSDDCARAREASLPAKTNKKLGDTMTLEGWQKLLHARAKQSYDDMDRLERTIYCPKHRRLTLWWLPIMAEYSFLYSFEYLYEQKIVWYT